MRLARTGKLVGRLGLRGLRCIATGREPNSRPFESNWMLQEWIELTGMSLSKSASVKFAICWVRSSLRFQSDYHLPRRTPCPYGWAEVHGPRWAAMKEEARSHWEDAAARGQDLCIDSEWTQLAEQHLSRP
jgi:hypothetical protein